MARQGSGADSDILLVHLQEEVGGIGNCGKRRLAASCRLKRTALFTSFDAICCIRTGSTSNSIYVEDTRTARFTQLDELTPPPGRGERARSFVAIHAQLNAHGIGQITPVVGLRMAGFEKHLDRRSL